MRIRESESQFLLLLFVAKMDGSVAFIVGSSDVLEKRFLVRPHTYPITTFTNKDVVRSNATRLLSVDVFM